MLDRGKVHAKRCNRLWKCEGCGKFLPRNGFLWENRFRQFADRCNADTKGSEWYCDVCADAREATLDAEERVLGWEGRM